MPQAKDSRIPSGIADGIPPKMPPQPANSVPRQAVAGTSDAARHGAWWGFSLCLVSLVSCVAIASSQGYAQTSKTLWILPGFFNSVLAFIHQHSPLLAAVSLIGLIFEIVILTQVYGAKKETGSGVIAFLAVLMGVTCALPTVLVILILLANLAVALIAAALGLCLAGLVLKAMCSNN